MSIPKPDNRWKHFGLEGEFNKIKDEYCRTQDLFNYGLPHEYGFVYWEDGIVTYCWNCLFCGIDMRI